nr:hypothetical protein [Tanacetum cinerariifolium]
MNDLCSLKEIKREFSNARTPQQNGVTERRNRTLIEAARTMLVDAKLSVTFWAKAVNTASYVQNRVLVNKSQNKTPYELFNGRTPAIGFLKPFGCHVMILNTLDNLGKFEAKEDEGYFIGYSMYSKAFRVHDALLESSSSKPQDDCSTDVSESRGNFNSTATLINPPADQLETNSGNSHSHFDSDGVEADVSNMETTITASPTPTLRSHKDHPKTQIIGPVDTPIQTKNKSKEEEGIDYDEVFTPVARIEAIRHFLAYVSFMGFTVYQMDVKSAFLYGTNDEEVYVMQPPGFQDPEFPAKVYKVEKAMYGLHQAPRAWYGTLSKYFLTNGFQMAYSDSDYGGAIQDRKSTTGGCQFLGRRLISWQCKKQTIMATSTTEAEYVAAASCCGQVMWIQNQLLDYGDCFEKKLISVDHIHTDENVADLLTKPFDAGRFQYLV